MSSPLNLFPQLLGNPAHYGRIIELVGPRGIGKSAVATKLFNFYGGAARWLEGKHGTDVLVQAIDQLHTGYRLVVVDGWSPLPDEPGLVMESRRRMQLFKRLYNACTVNDAVVVFTSDTTSRGSVAVADALSGHGGSDNLLKYYASDRLMFTRSTLGAKVTLVKTKTQREQGGQLFGETIVVWEGGRDVCSP